MTRRRFDISRKTRDGATNGPEEEAPASRAGQTRSLDAYGESEQRTAFYTLIEQHLETPFDIEILGVRAIVERIDMTDDEQIVAICRRSRSRQAIPILDLPLPNPRAAGAEWIEAYRAWAGGE